LINFTVSFLKKVLKNFSVCRFPVTFSWLVLIKKYKVMIEKSLGNKTAAEIFYGSVNRHARKLPSNKHDKANRLPNQLNSAPLSSFLKFPPGNRLAELPGNYK
jgi:hypothetical protein